jgi:predicted permease
MDRLVGILKQLRSVFRKTATETELDEEIRFHVLKETERLVREEGLAGDEARRRALLAFGGVERYKEEVRAARWTTSLDEIQKDLRYAMRMLWKSPGLTVAVVLTVALGIGGTTAVFSVVNSVLLEPLEYPEPEELVFVYSEVPAWGSDQFGLSQSEYRELQDLSRSFSEIGAWRTGSVNLSGTDRPMRLTAAWATGELFGTLRVPPRLGRTFTPEEDLTAAKVVVISNGLWRSAFGSDPTIVGRQIEVDGAASTIIGVMPEGFDVEESGVDVWMPAGLPKNASTASSHPWSVIGRLSTGLALDEAQRDLKGLLASWGRLNPSWHVPNDSTHQLRIESLREHVVGDVRPALLVLVAAVGFLLLIACANVMNLLLARAESRQREIAVRAAMGAGRRRLLRQFLTEGLVLSLLGGAVGLLVAQWGLAVLLAMSPGTIPRANAIGLDRSVLIFTVALSALVSVLFAIAPLSNLKLHSMAVALKGGGQRSTASTGRTRIRRALVTSQVALSVVLLIGSGLLVRSLQSLLAVDPGFEHQALLTFELGLPATSYPEGHHRADFLDRLSDRLEAIPGVINAAAMSGLPPVQEGNASEVTLEGKQEIRSVDYLQMVTTDYFRTMGIRMVAGRAFEISDHASARGVVIINETLARTFYPGEDPLGQRIRLAWASASAPWLTIVGVAEDVKQGGLSTDSGAELYFHYPQAAAVAFAPRNMHFVVRAAVPPLSLTDNVQEAVHALNPSLPIARLQTLEGALEGSVSRPRFLAVLMSIFAVIGLTLAAVGTCGVLSYFVATRRKELGIRMALGAKPENVLGIILRDGVTMAGAGLVLGAVAALGLTRLLSAMLFEISSADPQTYAIVLALLSAVAIAACWIPARQAARVDPIVVLGSE